MLGDGVAVNYDPHKTNNVGCWGCFNFAIVYFIRTNKLNINIFFNQLFPFVVDLLYDNYAKSMKT